LAWPAIATASNELEQLDQLVVAPPPTSGPRTE
jgi:hypothetical protein